MRKIGLFVRENAGLAVLMAVTAVLLTVTTVVFAAPFLSVLPLFVSLFVMALQANANRFGPLIGGFNSILYAVIYLTMGLYSSALYALLFSFPVQLVTFLRWNKRRYARSTQFRALECRWRWGVTAIFVPVLIAWIAVMNALGANNSALDSFSSLLGILISVLMMLSFVEYSWLGLLSGVVSFVLFVKVSWHDTTRIPYAIYMVYAYVCTVKQFISVRRLYREQQRGGAAV